MENKTTYIVHLPKNPLISIKLIPGHFATSSYHCNYYLDVSELKTDAMMAKDVSRELAIPYLTSSIVDAIVCMENTEVLGAYIAEELLQDGMSVINSNRKINIVTPINNVHGKLTFSNNVQEILHKKNVVLLISSISSGKTLNSAMECLSYYNANLVGISAVFCNHPENFDYNINALFTNHDISNYQFYGISECALCKEGQQLDALISSTGYTKYTY